MMDGNAAFTGYSAYGTTPSTIAALSAYAAEICNAEVARALARLGEVSARDWLIIEELAHRLVRNLLSRPMTVLNADADGAYEAHVIQRLFQLEGELPCRRSGLPTSCSTRRGRESRDGREGASAPQDLAPGRPRANHATPS
jgi:Glutamyl-tRNAGlu reductase, dimerisation domain